MIGSKKRIDGFFFFFLFVFLGLLFHQVKKHATLFTIDLFVLGLGVLGFVLIVIPEFVYLKDIYTTYFRANTMFKLVYQSFILLTLVSGYVMFRLLKTLRKPLVTIGFFIIALFLFAQVMIYPYFAIMSYFNNLSQFKGLDGTKYLQTLYPDDYAAIQWINTHIHEQPVMLEAQGDSYTDYERISSNTGLPTVFGWMVHEWLWRGTYDIVPPRIADVTALYTSDDLSKTKNLLNKYNVQYVYIGGLEHTKYPGLNEEKFSELGSVIYHHGNVTIYKIY